MKRLFPTAVTNVNRAKAGSEEGLAGRAYPGLAANRLLLDSEFRIGICTKLHRNPLDFHHVIVGRALERKVEGIVGVGQVDSKTSLRIVWANGEWTNFIVKKAGPAQICLKRVENFISEFEAQFGKRIPSKVKEALKLFIGRHSRQAEILNSISENFVGADIRRLERSYHNRLTLASMYGYDESMAGDLMNWFRVHAADLFEYCFIRGGALKKKFMPEFLWYHYGDDAEANVELFNLPKIADKMRSLPLNILAPMVRPRDAAFVGSTINLPFGNLQYHECALQFRHDRDKINAIAVMAAERNRFGSRPKESGHLNELLIANALNHDKGFRGHFCSRVSKDPLDFKSAEAGGKNAKQEVSVLGGKTPGKTDIVVEWKDGTRTNISVKKRASGQAYLVTAKNFIAAYEAQYGVKVPTNVCRALKLFIGEAVDCSAILEGTDISIDGESVRKIEREQGSRLVFDVIYNYNPQMAIEMLGWLKDEIVGVFQISFSSGAVADKDNWADVLWYKNLVDQDGDGLDYMVRIADVMRALEMNGDTNEVARGPRNGGSTIQLPFGHLQYHSSQLEFYQQMSKIQKLLAVLAA